MKILQKWNIEKDEYEPYGVPDDWNVKTYSDDMDEVINCAQCGKKIACGEGYTSLEVHTPAGFGYSVCEDCYFNGEVKRKMENGGDD